MKTVIYRQINRSTIFFFSFSDVLVSISCTDMKLTNPGNVTNATLPMLSNMAFKAILELLIKKKVILKKSVIYVAGKPIAKITLGFTLDANMKTSKDFRVMFVITNSIITRI